MAEVKPALDYVRQATKRKRRKVNWFLWAFLIAVVLYFGLAVAVKILELNDVATHMPD